MRTNIFTLLCIFFPTRINAVEWKWSFNEAGEMKGTPTGWRMITCDGMIYKIPGCGEKVSEIPAVDVPIRDKRIKDKYVLKLENKAREKSLQAYVDIRQRVIEEYDVEFQRSTVKYSGKAFREA